MNRDRSRYERDRFGWPDQSQIPSPPASSQPRGGPASGPGPYQDYPGAELPWEQQPPPEAPWQQLPPEGPPQGPPRHVQGGGRLRGGGRDWDDRDGPDGRRLALLIAGLIVVAIGAVVAQKALPVHAGSTPTATDNGPAATSGFKRPGLLTFRGNATRTYYGAGPVPQNPKVVWTYPDASRKMCSHSPVDIGEHQKGAGNDLWCGSGWTGQPSVFKYKGRTWVVFGSYDAKVHFVDWETGKDIIPPLKTGNIIKGSVTVDPDGFPLVYVGCRDHMVHAIAFDGPEPKLLWTHLAQDKAHGGMWNLDWDGSPLVLDDYMYEGGEDSRFHIFKLNRGYDAAHKVTVAPKEVFNTPGWDDELLSALDKAQPDRKEDVSIENSVAYKDGIVYFSNSGGLVQGWDVRGLAQGVEPKRVFRYWDGDDTDASVVIDDQGFLYVAIEKERPGPRNEEVGQLIKLDPRKNGPNDDPLVWSLKDPKGFWATPAIHGDLLIQPGDSGRVYGVDRATGKVRWTKQLPGPTWSSPVVVDDTWIQGDCAGGIHAYDVSNTKVPPPEMWNVEVVGCVESTPALWGGRLFVGTRGGRFVAVGD